MRKGKLILMLMVVLVVLSVSVVEVNANTPAVDKGYCYNKLSGNDACEIKEDGTLTGKKCHCTPYGFLDLKARWECSNCPADTECLGGNCIAFNENEGSCNAQTKGKKECRAALECTCVQNAGNFAWDCKTCPSGQVCATINSKQECTKLSCEVSQGNTYKCIAGQECKCSGTDFGLFETYKWDCNPCTKEGQSCNGNTGKCDAIANTLPSTKVVGECRDTEFITGGMCNVVCDCSGFMTAEECRQAVYNKYWDKYSGITADSNTQARAFRMVTKKEDCKVPAGTPGGGPGGIVQLTPQQKADRDKQCKTDVGADYSCIDITPPIKKEDYDCKTGKCNYGADATNPNVQCCKAKTQAATAEQKTEDKKQFDSIVNEVAKMIADEVCAPEKDKSKEEMEAVVKKAQEMCKGLLPTTIPESLKKDFEPACIKAVASLCLATTVSDKKPGILNDCKTTCNDPDGCMCPSECTVVHKNEKGENISTEIIRYQPNAPGPHIQKGSNCEGSVNAGICSGRIYDGICPRQCFFFTDVDCMSHKTAGFLIGDIAMRFFQKQKWYTDFMEWIEGWSKWIDPKQWMKSWCNPANRKEGIIDSVGIYSDDGEIYAWYGGEKAVYNYTKTGAISHYIYTVTWGIGNLAQNVSYKITMAKTLGGVSTRAFPANANWYTLKVGESHQGKDTAKAFFLTQIYSYVCMEFSDEFQGSTRYCREISGEGEYRATGDPAVVTAEGYTTTAGSTSTPSQDSGVNCQLSGLC